MKEMFPLSFFVKKWTYSTREETLESSTWLIITEERPFIPFGLNVTIIDAVCPSM